MSKPQGVSMANPQLSALEAELTVYRTSGDGLISKRAVRWLTSIGDTSREELVRKGLFPAPVRVATIRGLRWRCSDIKRFLAEQAASKEATA